MNRSISSVIQTGLSKKDACILDAEFRKIRKETGHLTTEAVWKAAQHKSSPLYKFFLHDTDKISRAYGIERARYLIKSVRLVVVPEKTVSRKIRGMINVRAWSKHSGTSDYLPTDEMMSKEDLREDLINRALAELESFKRKYAVLTELGDLLHSIDVALEKLRKSEKAA